MQDNEHIRKITGLKPEIVPDPITALMKLHTYPDELWSFLVRWVLPLCSKILDVFVNSSL
jgi:hypothetical protein